jgi:DNA-binding transcriptional ArsR family regulator
MVGPAAMPKHPLEAELAALTQEFVGRLVEAIRNASFAEVAALSPPRVEPVGRRAPGRGPRPQAPAASASAPRRRRQTAAHRAELGQRVVTTLRDAGQPMGVRALSSHLGVTPDALTVPLRELRQQGLVHKHGEKRNTTYSA